MQLEDERKLMRSVLSQFDDGVAKAEQQDTQPPAEVEMPHHDRAFAIGGAVLHLKTVLPLVLSTQNLKT